MLLENLLRLKSVENYEIIKRDINADNFFFELHRKFDIIFLDPPYKDKNIKNILKNINDKQILNKNGIIIIHRHKNEKDLLPENLKMIEEKKYGLSKIIFLN